VSVAVSRSASEPAISPELALVCPELRERWRASLPSIDADELFRVVRPARPAAVAVASPEPPVPILIAVAAYAATSIVVSAVRGAVTAGVVAALTLILTLAG